MSDPDPGRLQEERGDYEAVNSQALAEESLKNGRRWTFREVIDLGANAITDVVIANDFGSDTLRLVAVTIDPDADVTGFCDANVTIDTAGTAVQSRNGFIDGTAADLPAGITVEYGGTYSGGDGQLPIRNSGGVGEAAAKSPLNEIPTAESRLLPGNNLRYQIEENSGSTQKVTVEIIVARVKPAE